MHGMGALWPDDMPLFSVDSSQPASHPRFILFRFPAQHKTKRSPLLPLYDAGRRIEGG